ncbi:uncharacterized protein [Montipora foliosa]|uniref:uncharacterized protein isoform X2 n=1 Tax=Montipora foliosa TaxID=591990 RepID=UPI0035F1788B
MAQGGVNVSVEAEEISAQSKEALDVTLLGSEWNSSAGGLSTLNREFAIHLSKQPNVRVSLLVPEGSCKDEDKKEAENFGINVLDAEKQPGFSEPRDWLGFPPQDHRIDVVIGHGVKLGRQVKVIKRSPQFQNCKWVHMVHTAPEDLSKYKGYDNPTSRGEQKHWNEVGLCKDADLVVPVGPRLQKAYSSYLQGCKKVEDIFEIVPGLFDREFGDLVQQAKGESNDDFKVLLCGRGDDEDFELKGYDIAVKAFADQRLKGKRCYLLFVGALDGKQDEVRRRLLNCGITDEQLIVRKFVQSRAEMKDLFCEVDLVIMPSKSEGFGLIALEALSANLPVLVGSNSGFARALEEIDFGETCIVRSNDPVKWAKKIEGVRAKHEKRLREMTSLRESYKEKFCWKELCGNLLEKLWEMVHESSTFQATAEDGSDKYFAVSSLPVTVCQADPKIMEQHAGMMECEVTTCKENAKKSGKRKISESNSEEGMDSSGSAKLQRAEQQLFAVTPGALYKHSEHKEKINEEKNVFKTSGDKHSLGEVEFEVEGMDSKVKRRRKEETASGTSGDDFSLSSVAGRLMKIVISAQGLEGEKQEEFYEMLTAQVKLFEKYHHYSTDTVNGLAKLIDLLERTFQLHLVTVNVGSLVIIVDCQTLKGLDHLWNDYLSGHVNSMAEQYLVTDEMKQKLGLETISLKTTIAEENYVACRKAMEIQESGSACLSSQQDVLHHGSGTSVMDTSADHNVVSRSAFHRAAVNGQYEEVNRHLKNGANVDERDQFSLTSLHLACWYGHESVVKLLLDHNADINAVDRFQFTPLQKAKRCNHQSIIQLLLDHDAKPSFQQPLSLRTFAKKAFLRTDSHSGFNVLQAVVLQGDYDSVYKASIFLENFVEEMKCTTISNNASIFRGKSAVDILSAPNCRKPGHADIEKLYRRLVEIGETLNELHSCAKRGDVEKVIELVLNDGMDVNVAAKSNITPLLLASRMSSGVLIKTLIDVGADINAQTAPGKQGPLDLAASSNNYMVARLLLEHGADANIKNQWGKTLLHKAVMQNDVFLVKLLLDNKADVNIRDWEGETPVHKAVVQEDEHLVKLLLGTRADVNIQDQRGRTPLHKAVAQKHVPLVELLFKNKARVNIQDQRGKIPLHNAVAQTDIPLVKLLLEMKTDVNIQDQRGRTPLHKAVAQKHVPLVELLLKNKAHVNIQDRRGKTPLHKAVAQTDIPLVKLLLEMKADVNIQDRRGETLLHEAVAQRDVPLIKVLLEMEADVNIQDRRGETPLHKAVMQKGKPIVKLLLENKADTNIQDWSGKAPLHEAVSEKDVPLTKLLLENKANANIQDQWRETPLHKAVAHEDEPLINILLENKVDVNIQDLWGKVPLHTAVMQKDVPLVKLLLENKANANIQDRWRETPLHKVVTLEDVPIVKLLLENKANANTQDQWRETALHKAVTPEEMPIVKLLLENKADTNIQDWRKETPLHKAFMKKDKPLIKLLLENKADANILDRWGTTLLHDAVSEKDLLLIKLLLENKANVNIPGSRGETPLHKAIMENDEPLVKLFLENKADANIQDESGNTPLHLCARYRFSDISQLLIESGCNINLRNSKGETPRDIETFRRQWSKHPSAGYSPEVKSSTPHERFPPIWQEVSEVTSESKVKIKAEDVVLQ